MKGYYTGNVYMGYIPSIGKYWQFESETEYVNYIRETEGTFHEIFKAQ